MIDAPPFVPPKLLENGWVQVGRVYYPPLPHHWDRHSATGSIEEVYQSWGGGYVYYVSPPRFTAEDDVPECAKFSDLETAMAHLLLLRASR